jgi:ABC-type Mn2+/Zn2+ transport system ATPase subunit
VTTTDNLTATTDTTVVTPLLQTLGLSVYHGDRPALRRVDLAIGAGEVVGIVGPNGSGKSTLLKALVGLGGSAVGTIAMHGRSWTADRRPPTAVLTATGYVPQRSAVDLDFPIVVRQVAAMGLIATNGLLRRTRAADRQKIDAVMTRLGLDAVRDRHMAELSGGQVQRVFLARALVQGASVLLLDEPFTGVDATTENLLWEEVNRVATAGGTILVVHHDLAEVKRRVHRVVLLANSVVADGPPDVVLEPGTLELAYGSWLAGAPPGSLTPAMDRPLDIGC